MPLRLALLAIVLAPLSLPAQIMFERTYGGADHNHEGSTLGMSGGRSDAADGHAMASLSGTVSHNFIRGEFRKTTGDLADLGGTQYGHGHGWARFDIHEVPREASILQVSLWLYQYSSSGNPTRAVLVEDVMASAETLYGYLGSGMLLSDVVSCHAGWNSMPFYANGAAVVESCLAQGYVDIGVWDNGWFSWQSFYGYSAPPDVRLYLDLTFTLPAPYTNLAVANARHTSFPCRIAELETVEFDVFNQGDNPSDTFTAYLAINGGPTDSVRSAPLAPGEFLHLALCFHGPTTEQDAAARCYVSSSLDPFRSDDTMQLDFWVFPAYTTGAVDFEPDHCSAFPPAGWAAFNGGDTFRWMLNPIIDLYAHTGRFYGTSTGGGHPQDWLITSGLAPTVTTADTVGLFLRSSGSPLDSVEVWALSAQDPYAGLGLLFSSAVAPTYWSEFRASTDEYDGQLIYVGIRRFAAGWPGVCVDDVWFSCPLEGAVAEPNASPAHASAPSISCAPNPASGSVTISLSPSIPLSLSSVLRLFDATGRLVLSQPVQTSPFILHPSSLPGGVYVARLDCGSLHASTRLVVQK